MRPTIPRFLPSLALASLALACRKADPVAEMEKSAAAMEKAPPAAEAPAEPGAVAPAQQVKEAISEYKAGKMEDAVTRLQLLRSQSQMSPEQRMALQDSMATLMAEIYALAEKGDPKAVAAVAQYERMQTRGR
jgi:hypothetical protein